MKDAASLSDKQKQDIKKRLIYAQTQYKSTNYGDTINVCETIIQIDPKNDRAYHGKGLALMQLKLYKKALTAFDTAIQLNNYRTVIYIDRGDLYYKLEQYDRALSDYNSALALNAANGEIIDKKLKARFALDNFLDPYIDECIYYMDPTVADLDDRAAISIAESIREGRTGEDLRTDLIFTQSESFKGIRYYDPEQPTQDTDTIEDNYNF